MVVAFCEMLVSPETEELLEDGTVLEAEDNAEMSIFELCSGHWLFLCPYFQQPPQ